MKKLSFIIFLCSILAFIGCKSKEKVAATTTEPPKHKKQGKRAERLQQEQRAIMESLNLTDKQKEEVKAMNQEMRTKLRSLKEENQGNRRAMMASMRQMQIEKDKKIQSILTTQQYEQYKAMTTERRQKQGAMWRNHPQN